MCLPCNCNEVGCADGDVMLLSEPIPENFVCYICLQDH